MKKIFERIISKFKEFWGNRDKFSKSYFYDGEYHNHRNKIVKLDHFAPLRFMVSNIRGVEFSSYFEDTGALNKKKHCIYVRKNSESIDIKSYKRLVNFWEIIGNSRFDVFDSNRIDIDFWSHGAEASVLIKRKVVIVSVSEIFMN